jgi:hypothetical protein
VCVCVCVCVCVYDTLLDARCRRVAAQVVVSVRLVNLCVCLSCITKRFADGEGSRRTSSRRKLEEVTVNE